jgi:NADH-quinone oxidoreductase subunit B
MTGITVGTVTAGDTEGFVQLDPHPNPAPDYEPVRYRMTLGRDYDVWMFTFGLACCAVEFAAAVMRHPDVLEADPDGAAIGRPQVMVVSGTLTDKMAPALLQTYQRLPDPKFVVSFGSCANCGGPYWDSYCVTKGIDQIVPVDVYVPGCPPRPESLVAGVRRLDAMSATGRTPVEVAR